MVNIDDKYIEKIGKVLNDKSRPLKERFRALFSLRNIGGPLSIELIKQSFEDPSALLKHESAYCLGQMQDERSTEVLISVLESTKQEPIVRHEAAEALGAIGSDDVLPYLLKYKNDIVKEVAETCELAIDRINWIKTSKDVILTSPYNSVDPAPPSQITDIKKLQLMLLDPNSSLFEKYRAMFALRNLGTKEAVVILGEALQHGSALFKHEVAFVLGQMQNENSVPYLTKSLEDIEENEMVRHECAEALGSIATDECFQILNKYLNDNKTVVKESCIIALDLCEYENSEEFQYANTLENVS